MKRNFITCLFFLLMLSLALPVKAYAHGVHIEYSANTTVEIAARYDSGKPMAGAQVTVYAPDDPSTPWLTGVCDQEGRFSFTPDSSLPGIWDVQVRLAGHGDIIHIPIDEGATGQDAGGFSSLQIAVMAASIIWGCVGTALYFSRRRA